MRIEYLHNSTGVGQGIDLPDLLNPVWVGHHPRNHVVLPEATVGAEALAIDNDVVGGQGWRVWNRNGHVLHVGNTRLEERNQCVAVTGPRVVVQCPPYTVTLLFSPAELATEADEFERWDSMCAELVRTLHLRLVEMHRNDNLQSDTASSDVYVHQLEQEIGLLVAERPEFPTLDQPTTLGWHIAGLTLRSELIHRLVAAGSDAASPPEVPWKRLRSRIPEQETALAACVTALAEELPFLPDGDLSQQLDILHRDFWPAWRTWVQRGQLSVRLGHYLALRRLVKEIKDVWFGFGPLEDLLEDPSITEIMVLDADRIYIEKQSRIERSGRRFLTDPHTIAQRILAQANRQVNAAQPLADARMPNGSRVNVIIPPLALSGPTITIRRFPAEPLTMAQLIAKYQSLSPAACRLLVAAVANRRNIIVSGGTGTGKTTLLNALSQFIPKKERIVTIEDTAELQILAPHVVTLQARPKGIEGTGQVTIRELVRNALRMRPDRIVVGECRGGEAIDMLQAMNTGHDGSMTTLHANDVPAALSRLVVLVQQDADTELPVGTILEQIVRAVDLIVQLGERLVDGRRNKVVTAITELVGYDTRTERVRLQPLYLRDGDGLLEPTGHLPTFLPTLLERRLLPNAKTLFTAEAL